MTGFISESVHNIIILLLVLKGIDIITGISRGFYFKEFKASILKTGLLIFILELSAIALVIILSNYFGLGDSLSLTTIGLFVFKEFSSIIENLKDCGIDIPEKVLHLLTTIITNPTNNINMDDNISETDDEK